MENKNKKVVLVLILAVSMFFLFSFVSAIDFTPQGNIVLRDYYNITGAPYVNATTYYGDGSQLTGITSNSTTWWAGVSGWVSGYFKQTGDNLDFNETKLNETIKSIDTATNTSMKNYVDSVNSSQTSWTDSLFVRFTEIVGQVGNWTLDKPDYSTTATIDGWSLSHWTDDLGNRGWTHLTNFSDNLGNRGYTDLVNFTNSPGYLTSETDPIFTNWNNFTGIPHATPSNGDVTHFSWADEIYDWVIGLGYATTTYVDNLVGTYTHLSNYTDDLGNRGYTSNLNFTNDAGYSTTTGTVTSIATSAPLSGGTITTSGTLSITNDGIGDTQLAFNTGQHLTTTSNPTFNNQTITNCIIFASGGEICSGV